MSKQEGSVAEEIITRESNSLFEIVVGAYERILYGLSFCEKGKENELQIKNSKQSTLTTSLPYSISPFFIFPAHIGCIKSVNVGVSRYLASGSTDEFIKLYDMKSRKELGSLQEHKGSITCLEFVGKNHLVSGSEDGTIMIWRTKDWEVLKTLKGHTGKIHSLSVHPTGKLALSVGSDKLMFLWNMMTGHKASSIRLPKVADAIQWNKKGDLYAVMYESFIEIYSTASSKPINRIESSSIRCKFMSLDWSELNQKNYLGVGCSDGSLKLFGPIENADSKEIKSLEIQAHSVRIKALKSINLEEATLPRLKTRIVSDEDPLDKRHYLTTVSSDGLILVWDLEILVGRLDSNMEEQNVIKLKEYASLLNKTKASKEDMEKDNFPSEDDRSLILASYFAGVRLTCLSINFPYY